MLGERLMDMGTENRTSRSPSWLIGNFNGMGKGVGTGAGTGAGGFFEK